MNTNKVNYFEIGTSNPEESKSFYSDLFGWQIAAPSPANYSMVNETEGGIWDTRELGGSNYAIFYVQVDDVEATVTRAQELGGRVILPLSSNPAIEFAHLADKQGNRFGVWRPKGS